MGVLLHHDADSLPILRFWRSHVEVRKTGDESRFYCHSETTSDQIGHFRNHEGRDDKTESGFTEDCG